MKTRYLFLPIVLVITLLLFSSQAVYAKPFYFLIDFKSSEYKVNTIKLSAKELYGFSGEVELYNLKYKDRLILFSVLPSGTIWKEISKSEFQSKSVNFKSTTDFFEKGFQSYLNSDWENTRGIKRDDIRLVIQKDGKYLAANFCIGEYFVLPKDQLLFPNQMGDAFININSPILSTKDFEKLFSQKYKQKSPNFWQENGYMISYFSFFRKPLNFMSGTIDIAGKKAYRFWHYSDWSVEDGYNTQRGVDRFLYIPELGIVGGSYDFWFAKNIKGKAFVSLSDNYLEEKVMLPIEINGVSVK